MDTITIAPYHEDNDPKRVAKEMDIHADGYKQGYKDAIENTCEFLKQQGKDWWEGYGIPFSIDDYRKAMMEG